MFNTIYQYEPIQEQRAQTEEVDVFCCLTTSMCFQIGLRNVSKQHWKVWKFVAGYEEWFRDSND